MRIVATGMPVPTMNGAWVIDGGVQTESVHRALGMLRESGFPFCLQTRPLWSAQAAELAAAHQLEEFAELPLMAVPGPVRAEPPSGLSIRRLKSGEALLHCQLAGEAFGASTELFGQLMTPGVMELTELRAYVGEFGGVPVATAVSVTIGDAVGIFNVATPQQHRRHGYGAALTAHAVNEGLAAGAAWGWLQSSPAGYGVYERLGFVTLERWPCWISG